VRNAATTIICLLAWAVAFAPVADAAKTKPPAKRVVLGTTQLNGDQAQFAVTYTLGKVDPLNVTLDSAVYTVEPQMIGTGIYSVDAGEKLLVLNYTLHNPNPRERGLGWSTFEINAVDAKDTNWRFCTAVGMDATKETCNMSLKPAQKTKVYTIIKVPAKGEIPKLMFQSRDKLVLRYDLRGKVKPLPAPIADPSDPTGGTALESVPAQMGTFYPMRELFGKIDSVTFTTDKVNGRAPAKGKRYAVILGTARNNLTVKLSYAWGTFRPTLSVADGGEIRWNGTTIYPTRDETVSATLAPGQEVRFRWFFEVPSDLGLQSLAVRQGNGRSYSYDLSAMK